MQPASSYFQDKSFKCPWDYADEMALIPGTEASKHPSSYSIECFKTLTQCITGDWSRVDDDLKAARSIIDHHRLDASSSS